ncbi:MAG: TatD family hydrolase [Spirochaetia bacterium]
MIFDAHVHLQMGTFDIPLDTEIQALCNSVEKADMPQVLDLSAKHTGVFPYLGIHPWFISDSWEEDLYYLDALLSESEAGIGEVGLDKLKTRVPMERQRAVFRGQLSIAKKHKRPVNIHCVRAWGPLLEDLSILSSAGIPFLVHAFAGSPEVMQEIVKMGGYLSFAPFVLNSGSKKAAAAIAQVSEDRLLLDTDFPYQEGQPVSEYSHLLYSVYDLAADIRRTDKRALIERTRENGTVFTDSKAAR